MPKLSKTFKDCANPVITTCEGEGEERSGGGGGGGEGSKYNQRDGIGVQIITKYEREGEEGGFTVQPVGAHTNHYMYVRVRGRVHDTLERHGIGALISKWEGQREGS